MNGLFKLAGMYMAMTGMTMPDIGASLVRKQVREISETCKYLKCSKEELYEKWKSNKKLLSKDAAIYLENLMKENKKNESI